MLNGDQQIEHVDEEFSQLAENVASLTPAQYNVLCSMRDGLLNKQIGYNLEIAEATVKAHVTAIFRKLGINNRTQASCNWNRQLPRADKSLERVNAEREPISVKPFLLS
jgi:DNA-binding NarL/FixJ family response regulator